VRYNADGTNCAIGIFTLWLFCSERKDVLLKFRTLLPALALLALPLIASAQSYVLDFETDDMGMPIMDGTNIGHAYHDWGVHLTHENHLGDPTNHHNGMPYATNTNTFATSTDTGLGYDPMMGNIVHAYGDVFTPGWQNENGDPMLHVMFDLPVSSFSVDFIGDTEEMSHLMVYDENMQLVEHIHITRGGGGAIRNETLTYSGTTPIMMAMLGVGSQTDWVGIDNIRFTVAAVPEPGTLAVFGGLLAFGGMVLRRKIRG
jgi:hypothetical protein